MYLFWKWKSYVVPERRYEHQGPMFPFRKVLATNLTPDSTKAFLRICQEHKSTWSLQDLKSIFKPPSILPLCTYISTSKCAPDLHILWAEKIIGKGTSAVLSQNVDVAHVALIRIRILQLKRKLCNLARFPHPPWHTHEKYLAGVAPPLFPSSTFWSIWRCIPMDRHLLRALRCHILQRRASKGRSCSFF